MISDTAISLAKKLTITGAKSKSPSPKTVLDKLEAEYLSTEDETLSCGDSTITDSSSVTPNFTNQAKRRKQGFSPCRLIFSFLGSPFRRTNNSKEIRQPLLRCFSYEEILNATNNFNPGESSLH